VTRLLQRLLPKSISGQIAILVAIALFVAQGINFWLIVRERERQSSFALTATAVSRIVMAEDDPARFEQRSQPRRRGRNGPFRTSVEVSATGPAAIGARRPDMEDRAAGWLKSSGVEFRSIRAYDRPLSPGEAVREQTLRDGPPRFKRPPPMRMIVMGIERPDGRWLVVRLFDFNRYGPVRFGLMAQTLVLYIVVLFPLILVGRRIARPLRDLTAAARGFAQTGTAEPVEERGAGDVRDLTAAFNAMRSRLLAMLDEKDRMLGAIGHDLRTPLASLRVRTESVEDDEERGRMAETIDEMSHMLDDILSLARAGKNIEPMQRTDVSALADAVVEDFIELGQPVALADSARTVVQVRPQLIRRALRNLIENAIKYGERADVTVSQEGDRVLISVSDQGPGMPEDRMSEMTEAFTRLEGSRNRGTGGAGLGLALVKAIMVDHGGQLRLANGQNGGLVASLVLPA